MSIQRERSGSQEHNRAGGAGEHRAAAARSQPPGREVIQYRVEISPEHPSIKHTHPREEIVYVLEGSLEFQIEGRPTKTYNAGEALTVPAEAVHSVRNVGDGNAVQLATFVVEKGKPFLVVAE